MERFKTFISQLDEAKAGETCNCCDNKIDENGKCGCGPDCEHCGGQHDMSEAARRKGAPKMTGDSIAIQRAKDAEHNKAMGRTKTGRKKPVRQMTSTQRSLAQLRGEEVELDENTINDLTAQYINENDITLDQLENMTEEELNELIGKAIGGAFKVGAKAAVGAARLAKKGANRMSASGRADAAEKKADAVEKRNKDRARIKAAQDRVRIAKNAARENK